MYASINQNLESQIGIFGNVWSIDLLFGYIVCAYMHSLHAYTKHSMHFCMTERSDIEQKCRRNWCRWASTLEISPAVERLSNSPQGATGIKCSNADPWWIICPGTKHFLFCIHFIYALSIKKLDIQLLSWFKWSWQKESLLSPSQVAWQYPP